MGRWLAVLAFVLLACTVGSATAQSPGPDVSGARSKAYAATLVIRDLGPLNLPMQPVCGAVRVAPQLAVTAYHCTVPSTHTPQQWAEMRDAGGDLERNPPDTNGRHLWVSRHADWEQAGGDWTEMEIHGGTVLEHSPDADAAVIALDEPGPWVRMVAPAGPGQRVFAVHHSHGLLYTFGAGSVAATERVIELGAAGVVRIMQVDIRIFTGASGCGLFDDDGNLLGVGRAILQPSGIALYVPASEIRGLL